MKQYKLEWYVGGSLKETVAQNVSWAIAKHKEKILKASTHTTGKFLIVPMEENVYKFAEEVIVKSSFISKFIYRKNKSQLDVIMQDGHRYRYYDVTQNKFSRLKMASSKGQYYATKIRGKYPMRRLTQKANNQLEIEFN